MKNQHHVSFGWISQYPIFSCGFPKERTCTCKSSPLNTIIIINQLSSKIIIIRFLLLFLHLSIRSCSPIGNGLGDHPCSRSGLGFRRTRRFRLVSTSIQWLGKGKPRRWDLDFGTSKSLGGPVGKMIKVFWSHLLPSTCYTKFLVRIGLDSGAVQGHMLLQLIFSQSILNPLGLFHSLRFPLSKEYRKGGGLSLYGLGDARSERSRCGLDRLRSQGIQGHWNGESNHWNHVLLYMSILHHILVYHHTDFTYGF